MKPVEALNRLTEIGFGYCVSRTLVTGCELGVFDQLGKGPATIEELSGRLGIQPQVCRRLLMALRQLGLVERDGDPFGNSELGSFCTSQSPLGALARGADPFYHMFEFLTDAAREMSPRWQQALGASSADVFGALYADPDRLRSFAALMNSLSIPQGQVIAERFDFTPYRCVMDVAGGPGAIAVEIGRRYPHLWGIIMDMPPVCQVAEEHIQANGLSGRFTTAPADLFAGPYPSGADVLVLGYILHDWSDENCRKILRNCFQALPAGGALLVCERAFHNDFSPPTTHAAMLDMAMLVVCESGARERTENEYRALLEAAGFGNVELMRLEAPRDLIIARKA